MEAIGKSHIMQSDTDPRYVKIKGTVLNVTTMLGGRMIVVADSDGNQFEVHTTIVRICIRQRSAGFLIGVCR